METLRIRALHLRPGSMGLLRHGTEYDVITDTSHKGLNCTIATKLHHYENASVNHLKFKSAVAGATQVNSVTQAHHTIYSDWIEPFTLASLKFPLLSLQLVLSLLCEAYASMRYRTHQAAIEFTRRDHPHYSAPDLDGGGHGAQTWWEVPCECSGRGWLMKSLVFSHIINIYNVILWRHIC